MRAWRGVVGVVLVSASTACPPPVPPDAAACPNDLPSTCPTPTPSFAAQIDPIVRARCVPCHSPGGVSESRPLTTYDQVYALRTTVLTQVYGCLMPPSDATPLTPVERAALLAWLVCQAPDN